MKKILFLGSDSELAPPIIRYLQQHYIVYGAHLNHMPTEYDQVSFPISPESMGSMEKLCTRVNPSAIICATQISDEIECAKNPQKALAIHADIAQMMASVLRADQRMIYLSTSRVFSGDEGNYAEGAKPIPQSVYGQTKLRGEQMVLEKENSFVLRLGHVFGLASGHSQTYFSQILSHLGSEKIFEAPTDLKDNFFSVDDLALALGLLIDAHVNLAGIYHLANNGSRLSHYDFAQSVAANFALSTKSLRHLPAGIAPRDYSMDGQNFRTTFPSFEPTPIESTLQRWRQELIQGKQ